MLNFLKKLKNKEWKFHLYNLKKQHLKEQVNNEEYIDKAVDSIAENLSEYFIGSCKRVKK